LQDYQYALATGGRSTTDQTGLDRSPYLPSIELHIRLSHEQEFETKRFRLSAARQPTTGAERSSTRDIGERPRGQNPSMVTAAQLRQVLEEVEGEDAEVIVELPRHVPPRARHHAPVHGEQLVVLADL